ICTTKSSKEINRDRHTQSLHHPTRDIPQHSLTRPERSRGNLDYSYRHLRLKLTACSWLLSSPPIVTAGNVNKKVQPSPTVLLTNMRPPCIPTTSFTPERLRDVSSVFCFMLVSSVLIERFK